MGRRGQAVVAPAHARGEELYDCDYGGVGLGVLCMYVSIEAHMEGVREEGGARTPRCAWQHKGRNVECGVDERAWGTVVVDEENSRMVPDSCEKEDVGGSELWDGEGRSGSGTGREKESCFR